MGIHDILPFFGRNKEHITLELIKKHLDTVNQAVQVLQEFFNALESEDFDTMEKKREEILSLENDCDDIVHDIEENLYGGAFLPISRSRIIDFIELVDNLVDEAKDAANISMNLIGRKYDKKIVKLLVKLTKESVKCSDYLNEAYKILPKDVEKTKRFMEKIHEREANSDGVKGEVYSLLYELNDPMLLFMVSGIANAIAGIADAAENASDQLSIMILTNTA